jgi:hypothetical protein
MAEEPMIRLGGHKKHGSKASMLEALEEAIESVKSGDTAGLLIILMSRDERIGYRAEAPDTLMGGAALIGAVHMVANGMSQAAWNCDETE